MLLDMYYSRSQAVAAVLVLCLGTGVLTERLCLVGDFESQLQLLLDRHALSAQDHAGIPRLLNDTRATLRKQWKDFDLILFGSLLHGLGMKGSDVDYYVRIPNYNTSASAHLSAVQTTVELLQQQPELYAHAIINTKAPSPFITFFHIPTHRYCDVTYLNSFCLESSELLRYFFNLDERFLPLARMIKFWAGFHQFTAHDSSEVRLPNYAVYLLTVFYLQQKHLAPSVYELQRDAKSLMIDNWDWGFKEKPYTSNNTENAYQLLGGFFKYYSEFDFRNYVVSPFIGSPILRSAFLDIDSVPEELILYKRNIQKDNINPIVLNSDLCIQNTNVLNDNIVQKVCHEEASSLVSYFKFAAKMYEELPSDRFLTAILTQRQQATLKSIDIDDIIQKLKDNSCINATGTDL